MKIYSSHVKPGAVPVLVQDGFSWGAALFGCMWLAWQGAWIPAGLALLADVAAQLVQTAWYGAAVGVTLLLLQGIYGRYWYFSSGRCRRRMRLVRRFRRKRYMPGPVRDSTPR